ncbi:MAG: NUDIX hydrolase [Candidatus Micrarchaeales archaeon]
MGRVVYKDPWITIREERAVVRGKNIVVHKYLRKDVVVILPITKNGNFLIEKQYRHGLGKWLIEFPAGTIEKGESAISTAKRELEEETGFTASKITFMFKQYESPAVGKTTFNYYFATGLKKGGKRHFDNSEMIELTEVAPKTFDIMVRDNRIKDHKTISAYLYYKAFFAKK